MTVERSEGIIIATHPFRDYDRLVTLFTPERGIIRLLKKGSQNKTLALSPLVHIECTYFIGKSDLFVCRETTILHHFLSLRASLKTLEAACEMLRAIRLTQAPEKEASPLFAKLLDALHRLPKAPNPEQETAHFYLNVLKHEGLLEDEELLQQQSHPYSKIKTLFHYLISE